MKCLSECRDLNKTVRCSLWYDKDIETYVIVGTLGEAPQVIRDEHTAWKAYRATMLHGTNGMGIVAAQKGIAL